MMPSWDMWWIWVAAALILAMLELVIPGYVLLGFAVGAAVMGGLFALGQPVSGWVGASLPISLLLFACLSLAAWIVMRRLFGFKGGSVKTFDKDINED